MTFLLPFFVIIPILISVFLYVFSSRQTVRKIAILFQAAFTLMAFWLLYISRQATVIVSVGAYEGFLGITLRADPLAAVFILLATVIFLAVAIYSLNESSSRLFWFLLFLLEGTLIGLFLTRDLFNIFVLIEVSTVVVAILLMYDRRRRNMYAGMTFVMINVIVMQFYLFGVGYLYMLTGILDMDGISAVLTYVDRSELVLPYALIITGIAAKCSMVPLLVWLPKINSIPGSRSSIAAILSGLHIKSGIYLFIRFQNVFPDMATDFFLVMGILTAVTGIILALAQKDLRLILAYSTMAQVGLIIAGLNLSCMYSYYGSLFHIGNHAILKVSLFFSSALVIARYKTSDITKIRGLFREHPLLAAAILLAVMGMIGTPLFNGSISKYFLMSGAHGLVEWALILINLGTILVFIRFSAMLFGRNANKSTQHPQDLYQLGIVFGLGIICLALGIFGSSSILFLFGQTVSVDIWAFLEDAAIFAVSLGVGFLAYRYIFSKKEPLKLLCNLDISFKLLCASVGIFFAAILIFVGF